MAGPDRLSALPRLAAGRADVPEWALGRHKNSLSHTRLSLGAGVERRGPGPRMAWVIGMIADVTRATGPLSTCRPARAPAGAQRAAQSHG